MFSRLGMIIFILGITMADSECVLVPMAMVLIGIGLCRIGYLRGEPIWLYEEEDIDE